MYNIPLLGTLELSVAFILPFLLVANICVWFECVNVLLFLRGTSVIKQVQQKVIETFPNAALDEQFDERLIYKVPQTDVRSLAVIFEMLEKSKTVFALFAFNTGPRA